VNNEVKSRSDNTSHLVALSKDKGSGLSQMMARPQPDHSSRISVSHRAMLWPAVSRHIIDRGTIVAAADLHCIPHSGSSCSWEKEVTTHIEYLPSSFEFIY
jgi:hypothetical protein